MYMQRISPVITGAVMAAAFLLSNCSNSRVPGEAAPDPAKADKLISETEVMRIESTLASDAMKGRKTFSPEIDKAADFIAAEFKAAGLQVMKGADGFHQRFEMVSVKQTSMDATLNGTRVPEKNVMLISTKPALQMTDGSGYTVKRITAGSDLQSEVSTIIESKTNQVVLVDTSFAKMFPRLSYFKRGQVKGETSVIFLLTTEQVNSFSLSASQDVQTQRLANVVGMIPGKQPGSPEYVVFSGHYDHLGAGKAVNGDSIYNGANDDAAGTTAVIMLARYYAARKDNQRTLVFAAFTAEEVGGYGSQYFSKQLDPAGVVAMFNIEMIGTESKWGTNSAYITGYEKTNMGEILQKNLQGTDFMFHPDPYPDQQLFYRSDNATLARLGVAAHTISTSKMDNEPDYHKVTDEVRTLDIPNMTRVIHSIALSARSIIQGTDTPTRVKTEDLRR